MSNFTKKQQEAIVKKVSQNARLLALGEYLKISTEQRGAPKHTLEIVDWFLDDVNEFSNLIAEEKKRG